MPIEIREGGVYPILFASFSSIEKLGWNVRMCMKFFACIQRSTNSTSVSWVYDFSNVYVCIPSFSMLKQAMHLQIFDPVFSGWPLVILILQW